MSELAAALAVVSLCELFSFLNTEEPPKIFTNAKEAQHKSTAHNAKRLQRYNLPFAFKELQNII